MCCIQVERSSSACAWTATPHHTTSPRAKQRHPTPLTRPSTEGLLSDSSRAAPGSPHHLRTLQHASLYSSRVAIYAPGSLARAEQENRATDPHAAAPPSNQMGARDPTLPYPTPPYPNLPYSALRDRQSLVSQDRPLSWAEDLSA